MLWNDGQYQKSFGKLDGGPLWGDRKDRLFFILKVREAMEYSRNQPMEGVFTHYQGLWYYPDRK